MKSSRAQFAVFNDVGQQTSVAIRRPICVTPCVSELICVTHRVSELICVTPCVSELILWHPVCQN